MTQAPKYATWPEIYVRKLKWHKKRKKQIIHDMDTLVQVVWADLDNIEREINALVNQSA